MADERIVMVQGLTGSKAKRNGMCGVILTAAEAREEGVHGDVVVRLHNEGKVIGLRAEQALDVTAEVASLSRLPRSALAHTATDVAFLEVITAAMASKLQDGDDPMPWPNDLMEAGRVFLEVCAQRTAETLALARDWRAALHAAYADAIECYPDAEFASCIFMNRMGPALGTSTQLVQAFLNVFPPPKPERARLAFFDLSKRVERRFKELNRDHQQPSTNGDCWVLERGEWISHPTLFTRDPSNRDWQLPRKANFPPTLPSAAEPTATATAATLAATARGSATSASQQGKVDDDEEETELDHLLRALVDNGLQTETQVDAITDGLAREETSAREIIETWKPRLAFATKPIEPGSRVRLVGLENAAHLNGTFGMVLDRQPGGSDRWQVRLDSGAAKAIRATNLACVGWTNAELMAARTRARTAEDQAKADDLCSSQGPLASSMGPPGQLISAGMALMGQGKPAEAAAKYRSAIACEDEAPAPHVAIMAHTSLAHALQQCGDHAAALHSFLRAAELSEVIEGKGAMWAMNIAEAFRKLMGFPELPRPSWWNDAELLELSKQAVAAGEVERRGILIWHMRGAVLAAEPGLAGAERTAAQYREAAACYTKAADQAKGRPEEPGLREGARQALDWAKSLM